MTRRPRVLVCRLDNVGDVVLTGPAVRAVARSADVVYLASPRGAPAAALLPGVSRVLSYHCPWIDAEPADLHGHDVSRLVRRLREAEVSAALILTSSHQSSLPTALVLRLAGVRPITAISHDYAGSLLDTRLRGDPDVHEVERNLMVARAAGFDPAPDDNGALGLAITPHGETRHDPRAIVVHPGASVPARTLPMERWRDLVTALRREGRRVVVTGSASERALVSAVAGGSAETLVDAPLRELAERLAAASVVVCGNTGPAHVAAAVGTPVVIVHAPTVPASRWHAWGVPHSILGDQGIACAGCRSRVCPIPAQPCTAAIRVDDLIEAIDEVNALAGVAR
jgi:ADP-heptose:LPS heptosyltransferase